MLLAPPLTKVWVSFSDSLRAAKVRREISNCRSSARSWKYEAATSLTSVEITYSRAQRAATRFARAASVARRYLPQKSSCQLKLAPAALTLESVLGVNLFCGTSELIAAAPTPTVWAVGRRA